MSMMPPPTHDLPMPQVVYVGQKPKKINQSYKFIRFLFCGLALIVVLNLNILSNRIFGNGQAFSPIILLGCLLAVVNSKVSRINGVPLAATLFLVGLLTALFVGVLSTIAGGIGSPLELAFRIFKDAATPVVFFSTVLMASSLKKLGGETADKQVLLIIYYVALLGALTIFIPLVFPQWHYFIRGDNKVFSRFGGLYGNPNAASSAVLSFMVVGIAMTARSKKMHYLAASLIIGSAAIFLTGSRIGLLTVFFVVLPLNGLVFGFKHIVRLGMVGVVVLIVGAGLFYAVKGQTDSSVRSESKRSRQLLNLYQEGLHEGNTGGRTLLASTAIKMWQDSPMIGHGIGSSRPMWPYFEVGPHNYFLVVLIETGVFGFIPFVLCWMLVGFHSFDKSNQPWLRVLIIGLFLTLTAYAMTAHTVFTSRNQVFLIAAAIGLSTKIGGERR